MPRPRLAWFSPMPPVRSGVAACSERLVPALRAFYDIDVYVDASHARIGPRVDEVRSAHDFVWHHHQSPYDLTVFQLGNSATHEFIWPYLVRYPGLAVLHDAHLHHARAAALLKAARVDEYRAEFTWNHPDASPDVAELAIAGFDSHLYYYWRMTRLVVSTSRMVAVHASAAARELAAQFSGAAVEPVRLGHGKPVDEAERAAVRSRVRSRLGVGETDLLFGCFGGLSPDKRVPQILAAFAATRRKFPTAHLLLAGGSPDHYDPAAEAAALGIREATTMTGYLDSDDDLTAHIAACDVALTLRWPTAREISGPWLQCLAAGVPTVIVHLTHLVDVPALDPRTWGPHASAPGLSQTADGQWARGEGQETAKDGQWAAAAAVGREPICVAIDILDEEHSLRLAMRRLARDETMRHQLACAGQRYWADEHSLERMVEDYRRVIPGAMARQVPRTHIPAHLRSTADETLNRLLTPFGVPSPLR